MPVNEKIAAMKTPKRGIVQGGGIMTIQLTDYHTSSDQYDGTGMSNNSKEVGQKTPIFKTGKGLIPLDPSQPDYPYQFVEMGEDEQPLHDIMAREKQTMEDYAKQNDLAEFAQPGTPVPEAAQSEKTRAERKADKQK